MAKIRILPYKYVAVAIS